jgi:hypothetical protein
MYTLYFYFIFTYTYVLLYHRKTIHGKGIKMLMSKDVDISTKI